MTFGKDSITWILLVAAIAYVLVTVFRSPEKKSPFRYIFWLIVLIMLALLNEGIVIFFGVFFVFAIFVNFAFMCYENRPRRRQHC